MQLTFVPVSTIALPNGLSGSAAYQIGSGHVESVAHVAEGGLWRVVDFENDVFLPAR